jgi:deoxyribose-phosphate aldolase
MTVLSVDDVTYERLAKSIDHSLLRPELTVSDVEAGCELAVRYDVASVCARPADISLCVKQLADSSVGVAAVVGFPHGSSTPATQAFEARRALDEGATELDMVLNIGRLRSGQDEWVRDEIVGVVQAAARSRALVKVILENAYLDDEEKRRGCRLAEEAGADFVKTSTGFAPSGATIEDLTLMRAAVSTRVQVKAAGGVRTLDRFLEVLSLGVTRVGATATAAILDDYRERVADRTGAVASGR